MNGLRMPISASIYCHSFGTCNQNEILIQWYVDSQVVEIGIRLTEIVNTPFRIHVKTNFILDKHKLTWRSSSFLTVPFLSSTITAIANHHYQQPQKTPSTITLRQVPNNYSRIMVFGAKPFPTYFHPLCLFFRTLLGLSKLFAMHLGKQKTQLLSLGKKASNYLRKYCDCMCNKEILRFPWKTTTYLNLSFMLVNTSAA